MSAALGSALDLHCRDEGSGPAILFLHGVGGSHTVWNLMLRELPAKYRILAPDLRGHGKSPAPPGTPIGFADLGADLLQLLDHKGVRSAHVVGLSAGALLALRFGLEHPDRVRSLTLLAGSVYADSHTRAVSERWTETYAKDGADGLTLRLLKDLYYPDWIEAHMEFADQLREQIHRGEFRAPVLWAREAVQFDERGRIAQLKIPTLIVQGMDDQVVDAAHGRILRQSIPAAQIRIFAQTGHLVPVERPKESADAIASFVDGVDAGAVRPADA